MFVPARLQSERKGQTRKTEADQINDCFTRLSLCERRCELSPSEIAEGRTRRRKWKGRGTCQTRNQRVSCAILILEEEEKGKSRKRMEQVDGVTFSFCMNYFLDFYNKKKYVLHLKRPSQGSSFDHVAMRSIFCIRDVMNAILYLYVQVLLILQ